MRPEVYYVYFMCSINRRSLYIGVTNGLTRRVREHKLGLIPGYTRRYHCVCLVYYEEYQSINDAISREKELKGWTRKRKNALVEAMNPQWEDIAANWEN